MLPQPPMQALDACAPLLDKLGPLAWRRVRVPGVSWQVPRDSQIPVLAALRLA
jgi:hypothetical protein